MIETKLVPISDEDYERLGLARMSSKMDALPVVLLPLPTSPGPEWTFSNWRVSPPGVYAEFRRTLRDVEVDHEEARRLAEFIVEAMGHPEINLWTGYVEVEGAYSVHHAIVDGHYNLVKLSSLIIERVRGERSP